MNIGFEMPKHSKKLNIGVVVASAAGISVLVLLLLVGLYAFHHKRTAERARKEGNLSGKSKTFRD